MSPLPTVLTTDAGSLVGESNEWASVEAGEPPHATYGPFRSVWYSFTPSRTGNAVVEVDAQSVYNDLVVGVYSDNDFSAFSGRPRPEYQRLLADMAAGGFDAVVVWDLDRLHRDGLELEQFLKLREGLPIARDNLTTPLLELGQFAQLV